MPTILSRARRTATMPASAAMPVTMPAMPAATRLRGRRWRDARLWGGLACIVVAMFLGAAVLSREDGTVTVWQASRDLAPGAAPAGIPVTVALGDAAAAYLPATEPLAGAVRAPVAAGALIPRASLAAPSSVPTRLVTIPVEAHHAPLGMAPGSVVDVWSTPEADRGTGTVASSEPVLVLERVLVREAAIEDLGVGGAVPVVLEVPADRAVDLVTAARSGAVDLVAVPVDDALPAASAP